VAAQQAPVFDQEQGRWVEEALDAGKAMAQPVQGVVPKHNRGDQHSAFGDGMILGGHRVLGGIRNEDGHQEIRETDRTSRGLGASLAAGVESSASAAGWIVALGDMPRVTPATIRAVKEALEKGATIAAPFHDGGRGHPVGFSAPLRDELLVLDGDVGARGILERHAKEITRVQVEDRGIFVDVDTPEDMRRL